MPALMAVEFALRPRIKLREDLAPRRPARFRIPRWLAPAAGYWIAIAGLSAAFVRTHVTPSAAASDEIAAANLEPRMGADRAWWRLRPKSSAPVARAPEPAATSAVSTASTTLEPASANSDLEPAAVPAAEAAAALAAAATSSASVASNPLLAPRNEGEAEPVARLAANRAVPRPRSRDLPGDPARPERALSNPGPQPASDEPIATSLEPPRPAHPVEEAPVREPTAPSRATAGLPSCEAAIASASQDVDFSQGNRTADLPSEVIAAVLENGAWLSSCNVPEQTSIEVCVAIKAGRVVGASVTTRPADAALNHCVRGRAATLQFPFSPRLDVARTRF